MENAVFGRRYRVVEKLGSGGMADVYKAVDEVLGRTVAVKVLHPQYATEPSFVARFRQEAQAAANLSHPSIVNMYDWGREGDTYYIVMEYVAGTDLKTLLKERGPLDPMKAAEYAAQVCGALSVAHGYDVIHRDIKPHNIVLMPDGTVKVMDFGIARAGNTTMTQTGSVLGTAQYVSPEQAQGKPLGPASDLYSLGVTLYELVTGKLPFEGDTPVATALMHVNDEPVPPRVLRPSVPPALEAVILRAMRKNPADRYQSASEMREDLRRVLAGETAVGGAYGAPGATDETSVLPAVERAERVRAATTPQISPIPERRTSPWTWVIVASLVLILGLGGAWALGFFQTGTVVVPSLTGLTEEQARAALEQAGLTLGETATENSDSVDVGLVIRQDPAAGVKVQKGAAVNIVISIGVAEIEVPDLTTMTEAEAIAALRAIGLDFERSVDEPNADVEKGYVIRSEPAAGQAVPKGTRVVLFVSAGKEQVKVPDVIGKPLAQAKSEIEAAGLIAKTNEVFSDTVPKDSVVDQRPDPGVLVEVGTTVTLQVSKGPEVIIVPEVRTMLEADAIAKLESVGLKAKVVYVDSPDEGIVVNQFPIPGSSAKRGDIVEIEVGKTPSP